MKLLPVGFLAAVLATASSFSFEDKKTDIADFCQENDSLPYSGLSYCGPVSVSNILVHLQKNGFPNMIDKTESGDIDQLGLVKTLGSRDYMSTSNIGTTPVDMMAGLAKYVGERNYDVITLWRGENGGKYTIKSEQPDPDWLKSQARNESYLVLSVGFYKELYSSVFEKTGEHYIAVVGFQNDNEILIHDPSPLSGKEPKTETFKLLPMRDETLRTWCYKGLNFKSANGYWELSGTKTKSYDLLLAEGAASFYFQHKNHGR